MTTSHIYYAYTEAGTPQTVWAYNGGSTRRAAVVYACHMRDPMYEREPAPDELRLIVEYCEHFINAPCWVFPADEIRLLRLSILRVRTTEQLTGWLWLCGEIGLGPVLGVTL
jgi:hypothetical protein